MLSTAFVRRTLLVVLFLPFALSASADTGRSEINQAIVNAAGGFPYTIRAPGSYVLTSDLIVSANVTAVSIEADEVTLDLNGFRIVGPHSCSPASCPTALGNGLGTSPIVGNRKVSIFGGQIRGFGFNCILVGSDARVERMTISECGQDGIVAGSGSSVLQNTVFLVGREGIDLQSGSVFAHNLVRSVGLSGPSRAIARGTAIGGNYCDDGSCSADGRRLYYLTTSVFSGAEALSACVTGFHMASLWEIMDPSQLKYDVNRGFATQDSGSGPPSDGLAWIRTGESASSGGSAPGRASCEGYTVTTGNGTSAVLYPDWEAGGGGTDSRIPWWRVSQVPCALDFKVWCVEE